MVSQNQRLTDFLSSRMIQQFLPGFPVTTEHTSRIILVVLCPLLVLFQFVLGSF